MFNNTNNYKYKIQQQIGQAGLDKLNIMKDNSTYETNFADHVDLKSKVLNILNSMNEIQKRLPQSQKQGKINGVTFTYYSFMLESKPIITKEFRRKIEGHIKEVSSLNTTVTPECMDFISKIYKAP